MGTDSSLTFVPTYSLRCAIISLIDRSQMLIVVLLVIICVISVLFSACGDTPGADREVLVTLYNATNGPGWDNNEHWMSDKPIGEWYGVRTLDGRVVELYLSWNELTGEIPPELGKLSNLEGLALWSNDLNGEIPPELGKLSNLKYLALWGNSLSGEIPPELGNLSKLIELDLSYNELTGEIPSELGKLSNLELLELDINELCGEIPPELDKLSGMDYYSLPSPCWHTPESDREVLITLYNATNGPSWNRSDNWLSDEPIGEWYGVTTVNDRVTALMLYSEGLRGEIPPELGKLFSLEHLSLWANNLSGEIPPELSELSNLEELNLRENELTGEIPPELGKLSKLERLWLNYNKLSGEIPSELGKLSELNSLYLAGGNRLAGCIPRLLHYARSNDLSELPLADC